MQLSKWVHDNIFYGSFKSQSKNKMFQEILKKITKLINKWPINRSISTSPLLTCNELKCSCVTYFLLRSWLWPRFFYIHNFYFHFSLYRLSFLYSTYENDCYYIVWREKNTPCVYKKTDRTYTCDAQHQNLEKKLTRQNGEKLFLLLFSFSLAF